MLELSGAFDYHFGFVFQGFPVFLYRLPSSGQAIHKLALALSVAGILAFSGVAFGRGAADESDLPTVALSTLPDEARRTSTLIRQGGPFEYAKDGSVFGNREKRLPGQPRGYYREYTVKTPGARDRGARRIVCGGSRPTLPDSCYYTGDHYASFARIVH